MSLFYIVSIFYYLILISFIHGQTGNSLASFCIKNVLPLYDRCVWLFVLHLYSVIDRRPVQDIASLSSWTRFIDQNGQHKYEGNIESKLILHCKCEFEAAGTVKL